MASHLCVECGRNFRSSKALHGHLRCHPERNYRGVRPRSPPRQPPPYRRPPALLPRWMLPLPMDSLGHKLRYPYLGVDEAVTSSSTSSSAAQEPLQVHPPPRLHISDQMPPKIPFKSYFGRHPSDETIFSSAHNLSLRSCFQYQRDSEGPGLSSSSSSLQQNLQISPPRSPSPHMFDQMSHPPFAVIRPNHQRHPADPTVTYDPETSQDEGSEADEPDHSSSHNATESGESDTTSSSPAMQEPLQALPPPPPQPLLRLMPPDSYIESNPLSLLATLATDSALDEHRTVSSSSSLTMRASRHGENRKMDELIGGGTDHVQSKGDHICRTCFKSFGSHQALGGHMTIHLTNRKGNTGGGGKPSGHHCAKCGEVYPTGQALGGHMRKHWPVPERHRGFKLFGNWIPFNPS